MYARVVTFEGVDDERMAELAAEIESGQPPVDIPATEIMLLHDSGSSQAVAILFFENEDDYRRGDDALNAMPAGDTPGRRTSVTKYRVATRMTAPAVG